MRITGGRWRGRIVACPPGEIRPAMDRMRESMFAILGPLDGLGFLDLFSGSGVVALEALSRGASRALLVEKDPGKKRTIQKNLSIAEGAEAVLLIRPVERVLRAGMPRWDVVHLDPPFPLPRKESLLRAAEAAGQPAPGGVLMIHYPSEETLPERVGALRRYDERRYGRSLLAFYTRDD
jgi:16S rRNA (guanine966-N2)-methyltransferase